MEKRIGATSHYTGRECSREMIERVGGREREGEKETVSEKGRGREQVLIGEGLGGVCQAGQRYLLSQCVPKCEAHPSGKLQMCEVIIGKTRGEGQRERWLQR